MLTVKPTVNVPAVGYVYNGFDNVDVLPSPNVHDHAVTGPVDASVNWIGRGLLPDVGLPVKMAFTGSGAVVIAMKLFMSVAD